MIPMKEFPTSEAIRIQQRAMVIPIFSALGLTRLEQLDSFMGNVAFMSDQLSVNVDKCYSTSKCTRRVICHALAAKVIH